MHTDIFKNIIVPQRKLLLNIAYNIVKNNEDAEDAVQEALLKLWKTRDQLTHIENPMGYAVIFTKNVCLDIIRKRKENITENEIFKIVEKENIQNKIEEKNLKQIVEKIIEKLPTLQALTIKMKDIEGYEIEEIANITGSNAENVRMNLSRARKKVKKILTKIIEYEKR